MLGSQIALQKAYKAFHVNVYDISDEMLDHATELLTKSKENYKEDLRATQQAVDEAFNRISLYADLAQAIADADLVIEAIPEVERLRQISIPKSGQLPRRRRSLQQTHPLCCRVISPKQLAAESIRGCNRVRQVNWDGRAPKDRPPFSVRFGIKQCVQHCGCKSKCNKESGVCELGKSSQDRISG